MKEINLIIKSEQLNFKKVKLRANWKPILEQDLFVYLKYFAYKKKPKTDSWCIKRLKK